MLHLTPRGLFCPAGNFHIDPSGAVDNAVITHAHSDHARRGSAQYYCVKSGVPLLKTRIGKNIAVKEFAYGEKFQLGRVQVSFHPAGHILGSSQVRMQFENGEVWVASGDYKRDPDPSCEPFEVVKCDVYITEATFGTPSFRWNKTADYGQEIATWWRENASRGINSVLFAYTLGKAQRVLSVLEPHADRAIYLHSAATELTNCYRAQGVKLAKTICLSQVENTERFSGELFLVPKAFLRSEQAAVLGERYLTAFASGWTGTGWGRPRPGYDGGIDKGFLMSDHADWDDLVRTIRETEARRVYVQHRGHGALVRHLNSMGLQAEPDEALRKPPEPEQLSLFGVV